VSVIHSVGQILWESGVQTQPNRLNETPLRRGFLILVQGRKSLGGLYPAQIQRLEDTLADQNLEPCACFGC
jgi:hypothetical protein